VEEAEDSAQETEEEEDRALVMEEGAETAPDPAGGHGMERVREQAPIRTAPSRSRGNYRFRKTPAYTMGTALPLGEGLWE